MNDSKRPGCGDRNRPDRRDRLAVIAVGIQFWINGMAYAAVVPRLPDIRDRLGIGVAALGTMLTIGALGGLLGSAFSERVIGRLGTKRCIQIGTLATVLALPFVGIASTPLALILVIALLAVFDVVIDIAMNLQGSWLSARRVTPIMNRLHGLWSLGTVIGGLIAVRAAGAGVSLAAHLLAISVILAMTLLASTRFLLDVDEAPADRVDPSVAGTETDSEPTAPVRRPTGWLSPRVLLMVLGAAAVSMELTTSDWAAFRLADDLGAGPGRVGLGFVAFTCGMVTGRFAGDNIQAAVGKRTLVRAASILAIAGLLLATVTPYQWFGDDAAASGLAVPVTIVGFFVAALGVSVIFPQLYDAAAQAPGRAGSGLAALTAGTRMASIGSPIIVGALAATELSVGTAIVIVTVPACVITLLTARRATGDQVEAGAAPVAAPDTDRTGGS